MPGLQGPDRVGPQGRPERAPTCASRFRPLLQEVGVGRPLRGRGGSSPRGAEPLRRGRWDRRRPGRLPGSQQEGPGWPARAAGGDRIPEPDHALARVARCTAGGAHAGRAGTRFPAGAMRWCAPSCPPRRRSDSGARTRRTRGAAGHPGPSRRALSSRQVFLDPSVALNGSTLRARILSSRAASETERADGGLLRAA